MEKVNNNKDRLRDFLWTIQMVVILLVVVYVIVVTGGLVVLNVFGDQGLKIFLVSLAIFAVVTFVMIAIWLGARIATQSGRAVADVVSRHDLIDAYGDVGRLQASMMGPLSQMHRTEQLTGTQIARLVLQEARRTSPADLPPTVLGDDSGIDVPRVSSDITY